MCDKIFVRAQFITMQICILGVKNISNNHHLYRDTMPLNTIFKRVIGQQNSNAP